MSRIRVLIVDDAVVIRRLVGDVLASDPEIDVVGTAANGRIALQKITQVNPDVVTMDVEMPDMDGIATVREVRKTWPKLPIIMFSTLTERGGAATLDALAAGASDYVTKPANVGSVTAGLEAVRRDLIPKIKGLAGRVSLPPPKAAATAPLPAAASGTRVAGAMPSVVPFPSPGKRGQGIDILAIGVSTGGPNALAVVLPSLPKTLPVPVVVVQHMPPMFTRLLAERLNAQCALEVVEAKAGMVLAAGRVYIAPGDYHMVIERQGTGHAIALTQAPPENSCRPAVDVLFRSVVEQYRGRTLGVILTGMGQDGLRGCELIREAGGEVLAQDEATSVVWGMPGFVARAGLANRVLPLDMIGAEVIRRCGTGSAAGHFGASRVS